MAETFVVETRGIGKPDYSRAVSSAKERKGILIEYGQGAVIFSRTFSPVPSLMGWVRPPLAAGDSDYFVDTATGFAMPYTVPKGYTLSFIEAEGSTSEYFALDTYYEPATPPGLQLIGCHRFGSGLFVYAQEIAAFTTAALDAPAASAHLVATQITNLGGGPLSGGFSILALLAAVGTPPFPNVKTVKCKHCGHEHVVPVDTSEVICSECHQLTIYHDLSRFRET